MGLESQNDRLLADMQWRLAAFLSDWQLSDPVSCEQGDRIPGNLIYLTRENYSLNRLKASGHENVMVRRIRGAMWR